MNRKLLLALACLVSAALGFGTYRLGLAAKPVDDPLPPGLVFSGLDGGTRRLEQWQGKLLLVNFWATWCTPCLAEIPELVKLQNQYAGRGLQIIGPAVDDPAAVKASLQKLGINYPVLSGSTDALVQTMEKLGNDTGAMPFSILVSPDGHIIDRHLGGLSAAELQALVMPHLPVHR